MFQSALFPFLDIIDGCCNHLSKNGAHTVEKAGGMTLEIYADQYMTDKVMINLFNNAVRFAPKSNNILIGIERISNAVKISVTDKGIGIADRYIASIFKKVKKVDIGQIAKQVLEWASTIL